MLSETPEPSASAPIEPTSRSNLLLCMCRVSVRGQNHTMLAASAATVQDCPAQKGERPSRRRRPRGGPGEPATFEYVPRYSTRANQLGQRTLLIDVDGQRAYAVLTNSRSKYSPPAWRLAKQCFRFSLKPIRPSRSNTAGMGSIHTTFRVIACVRSCSCPSFAPT
jgi:hypothetical protein